LKYLRLAIHRFTHRDPLLSSVGARRHGQHR
jgi:hypothetical protein